MLTKLQLQAFSDRFRISLQNQAQKARLLMLKMNEPNLLF